MKHARLIAVIAFFLGCDFVCGQDAENFGFNDEIPSFEELAEVGNEFRNRSKESGFKANFDATYVFQGVASGGLTGQLFSFASNEGNTGNTFAGDLRTELDTQKAGWWNDGNLKARLQARTGQSIVQRAGTVSAVNNDALFPNVESNFDGTVYSLVELTYRHSLNETVGVYGGLLNTALGDQNAIAGTAQSHAHFMNFAFLYSLVEDATTPQTTLGAGIDFKPNERVSGSFSVYGSDETSGSSPFRTWRGTSLNTEWTVSHTWQSRPGAQTFGALYGFDILNTDQTADPRLAIISIIVGVPIPAKQADTWAIYYNAHQFIQGDENGGWGAFARWGISDGNQNFVKQDAALGLGGVGLLPNRNRDRWGVGAYFIDMSNTELLSGLRITDEVGGEAYYNVSLTERLNLTFDAQVIDSALKQVNTAWVLGVRTNYSF